MRYKIKTWNVDVPCDIEIYRPFGTGDAELIPHSEYGARFRREALIQAAKNAVREFRGEAGHGV